MINSAMKRDRSAGDFKIITKDLFCYCRSFCQSYIGKKGGKQLLSLGEGCKNRGHVTHELVHALGFFHEHTRPDRDKFVRILWENIKSGNMKANAV